MVADTAATMSAETARLGTEEEADSDDYPFASDADLEEDETVVD